MTRRSLRSTLSLAAWVPLALLPAVAAAHGELQARLDGYQEVPALSTAGSGRFKASVDRKNQAISYSLSYDGLEGAVQQAHIHLGQRGVSGGITVFLCTNLGNAPAGVAVQACPPPPATISGVIQSLDVVGPGGQGIEAGAFAELVNAIDEGVAYANVHTAKWPTGEIRGQIR